METKVCKICETVFNKPPRYTYKKWDRRFCCSKKCSAKYRGCNWLKEFNIKKGEHFSPNTQFKKGHGKLEKNQNWKGDNVGYFALHTWISRQYGKPTFCEHCKTSERIMYHWANISGEYKRDRNDWLRLCVSCHKKYDLEKISKDICKNNLL